MTGLLRIVQRELPRRIDRPVILTDAALAILQQATRGALLVTIMQRAAPSEARGNVALQVRFAAVVDEDDPDMLGRVDAAGSIIVRTPTDSEGAVIAAETVMFLALGRLHPELAADPVGMRQAMAATEKTRGALARAYLSAVEASA